MKTGRKKGTGFIDIPLKSVYGSWTVIGPYTQKDNQGAYLYPCRCECGTEKLVPGSQLYHGLTRSCIHCAAHIKEGDITGRRFGRWTVIRWATNEERTRPNANWVCRCDCGTVAVHERSTLKKMKVTSCCDTCPFRVNEHARASKPYEALFNVLVSKAKQKHLACTVTYEDFLSLIAPGRCHYCWWKLEWSQYCKASNKKDQGYKLDRKDNTVGYVGGNLVPCCKRCNYGKGHTFTYEEWFGMTAYFRNASVASLS